MEPTKKLPFGQHSVIPALANVAPLRKTKFDPKCIEAPKCLRLSQLSLDAMATHIKIVGIEHQTFKYNVQEQSICAVFLEFLSSNGGNLY